MKKHFLLAGFAALILVACNNKPASELTLSGLDPVKFQTEVNNAKTALYTLKNKAGMEVCITNFGGRIVSVMVPDKNGKMQDVVLGFDSIADYINVPSDFGASIGRYANRINRDVSHWTVTRSNCRKTISATACTEVRKVGNTKFMKLI